jgi:predicted GNAT family acetyltransferase
MSDSVDVTVSDNPEAHRYEAVVDGEVAGFAEYRLDGDVIDFNHTVVEDAYEGKGIGSRLAAGALDDVRARGLQVVATCTFIKGYIERHEAYQDLLAS